MDGFLFENTERSFWRSNQLLVKVEKEQHQLNPIDPLMRGRNNPDPRMMIWSLSRIDSLGNNCSLVIESFVKYYEKSFDKNQQ